MIQTLLEIRHALIRPTLPPIYEEVLNHYSDYYRQLEPALQLRFKQRLHLKLKSLKFIQELDMEISEHMKIIIAAAFVKVTFGLKKYINMIYRKISIVPDAYTYPGYGAMMTGDVNTLHKMMTLSWKHVEVGFLIEDDAMNVAMHEVSHAVTLYDIEVVLGRRFLSSWKYAQWEVEALKKLATIHRGENKLFSDYAGVNMMEMFAVSIETFFERSEEFSAHLPELYAKMKKLLNQDPANKENPIIRR